MNPSKTSEWGARLLQKEEGTRLRAYKDTVGVWTIGVGHTGRMSPPAVTKGMQITEAQAAEYLANDLAPVEAAIVSKVKVPITQSMFDALASFTFNVGKGGFAGSTLLRKLNAGDYQGAADQFLVWVKQPELKGRRDRERALFLKDGIPSRAPAPASARKAEPPSLPPAAPLVTWFDFGPDALTKRGDDDLRMLQQYLLDLGYKSTKTADGIWGTATIGALAEFRAFNDLPDVQADLDKPRIDERTRTRLMMRNAHRWVPSAARASADEATVARKAPWLAWPAILARRLGKGVAVAGTGAASVTVGAANQLGESWSMLSAAKDFITSPWVLGGIAVLLALALWAVGSGVMKGGETAVRTGELN